jgi:CRP-like cAMP-binding protein
MRHSLDPKVSRLRRVRGMGDMSDTELRALAALVEECEAPAGTVLVREGAVGRSSYIIVEGWAAVTVGGRAIAVLGPGEHIGEMAMLDHGFRSASVTSKSDMRLLEIGPAAMPSFLQQPGVLRAMATGLAARVRVADAGTQRTPTDTELSPADPS